MGIINNFVYFECRLVRDDYNRIDVQVISTKYPKFYTVESILLSKYKKYHALILF